MKPLSGKRVIFVLDVSRESHISSIFSRLCLVVTLSDIMMMHFVKERAAMLGFSSVLSSKNNFCSSGVTLSLILDE